MQPFEPLVRNPHVLTILANFWPRPPVDRRWRSQRRLVQTEPGVRVAVVVQEPDGPDQAHLVLVHGLEGSSDAGYKRSMAFHALELGYSVHRFNMRSCGGTEDLAHTNYHAGQTGDLLHYIRSVRERSAAPIFIAGFSLGGNVVLKLAGELGSDAAGLIAGVCAVSTPIDLAACVRLLDRPENAIYAWRFLSRLKERIRTRARQWPAVYSVDALDRVRTVYDFDDLYTAPLFGFGRADNYYATQSSKNFLGRISVPALLVQAQDDPLIPFGVYSHPAFRTNRNLELVAPEHGGHLGFLSRRAPRFWLDPLVLGWCERVRRGGG